MNNTVRKVSIGFFSLAVFALIGFGSRVQAASLLPQQIIEIFNLLGPQGSGAAGFVTSRIQLALVIALGAVVLVAVVYSIIAAFKYISSQGDAGKIEEAQKAIRAIFLGIAAMLIAIVGIVLVFVFFGAARPDPSLYQVCLSAPNSIGCAACYADTDPAATTSNCFKCDQDYVLLSKGQIPNQSYSGGSFQTVCREPIKRT
jgi:hypothetical protein